MEKNSKFMGIVGSVLLVGVLLITLLFVLGDATPVYWDWNEQSWQAVATGLAGVALAAVAILTYLRLNADSERQNIDRQSGVASNLLKDGYEIFSLKEGWILEGGEWDRIKLSEHKTLPETLGRTETHAALHLVEVRALLDQAVWNSLDNKYYRVLQQRRAWIVRDYVVQEDGKTVRSFTSGFREFDQYARPGLISSKGRSELSGWIERIATAREAEMLPDPNLEMLRPLLDGLAGEDRVEALILTNRAKDFLKKYRELRPGVFPDNSPPTDGESE